MRFAELFGQPFEYFLPPKRGRRAINYMKRTFHFNQLSASREEMAF